MATHHHDLSAWQHAHVFDPGNPTAERSTRRVALLTLVVMCVEIAVGTWSGSMALLADGWHMGTHAAALGGTALAYALARRYARDARFAFGTWKIEILASFSSALLLAFIAIAMAWESAQRFFHPESIHYPEALAVAVAGLVVNIVSVFMLGSGATHHHHAGHSHESHTHGNHAHHDEPHAHHQPHEHQDLNFRAAYWHVITDAVTSVLAIIALAAGMGWGWAWLDPAMGLVGAGLIARWAWSIGRASAKVLLDREMDAPLVQRIRAALESDADAEVADLHVWRVGREHYAAIACLVADRPQEPDIYRARLKNLPQVVHASIEVNRCRSPRPNSPPARGHAPAGGGSADTK